MSDKEKDFGKKAKEFFEEAGEQAKESAREFTEGAKETAREFAEGAKDTFGDGENKRILVGVLALLLGTFGVHKFILGYHKEALVMLGVSVVLGPFTCGVAAYLVAVVGLIEGVIYLTKTDIEFYNTYVAGRRAWF